MWKDRLAANPHLAAGLSQHPKVAMIGGGAPILVGGAMVGALGIAGGLEDQDVALVTANPEGGRRGLTRPPPLPPIVYANKLISFSLD